MLSRMAEARLTFRRGTTWQDFVRSYTILVDGVEVGSLRRGATLSFEVSEGPHTCQARISWTGSRELLIAAEPGAEIRVLVSPAPRKKRDGLVDRALSTDAYLVMSIDGTAN